VPNFNLREAYYRSSECFFLIITRQAVRHGSFLDQELIAVILAFLDRWNDHPVPSAWTKGGGQILTSIQRAKTKTSGLTY
jgi:hypothetical protein